MRRLFDRVRGQRWFSNRGTSGIDGCTSTAVGAAHATQRSTTLITGDIAFCYDSNAFWNAHLSPQLKVIVIDNGGGNIFRYIEGPDTDAELLPVLRGTAHAQHREAGEELRPAVLPRGRYGVARGCAGKAVRNASIDRPYCT